MQNSEQVNVWCSISEHFVDMRDLDAILLSCAVAWGIVNAEIEKEKGVVVQKWWVRGP
jgi:hypothetical protein